MSSIIEQGYGVGDVISLLWFKRSLPRYCTKFIEVSVSLFAFLIYSFSINNVLISLWSATFENSSELDMHNAVCWSRSMRLWCSQHHCNSKSRQRPCLKSCLRSVNIFFPHQTHQFSLSCNILKVLNFSNRFTYHWSPIWWCHWWRCSILQGRVWQGKRLFHFPPTEDINSSIWYLIGCLSQNLTPYEFVEGMKKKGIRVPGIGHR